MNWISGEGKEMDTYTYEASNFYRSMRVTKAVHTYLLQL